MAYQLSYFISGLNWVMVYAVISTSASPVYSVDNFSNLRVPQKNDCILDQSEQQIRVNTSERLAKLREKMQINAIHAYVIPQDDEHQSEYVAPEDNRVNFISGFSGSSGTAVVTLNEAALWTDGRYFLQASKQLDCNWNLMKVSKGSNTPTIEEWLKTVLNSNDSIGLNPKLVNEEQWNDYKDGIRITDITLKAVEVDIIDEIWNDKIEGRSKNEELLILNISFSGKSWQDKTKEIRQALEKESADALVVTALDNIAWLFNLRGYDIPTVPVFKAYSIISTAFTRLYVRSDIISKEVKDHLQSHNCSQETCVQLRKYEEIGQDLEEFVPSWEKVWLSQRASHYICSFIPKQKMFRTNIPIEFMQAIKNPTEIQGMKTAHLRDSVAVIDFLAMLEEEVNLGIAWDELMAAEVVKKYRSEQKYYQGLSFQTIAASGSNGAIIHYKPSNETNKPITTNEFFLLDSGAQYLDGTTDITRTLHYGNATDFEKEAYTRVLKGAIDVAKLIFPSYLTDAEIDTVARLPLYEIGLEYLHGTGHGIGSFLGVHEGPFRVTNGDRIYKQELPLQEGMFLSDEPGFYEDGQFGIRLENIVNVVRANTSYNFNNITFLGFEIIDFVPFEPKLIKVELLTKDELKWINDYHAKVKKLAGDELLKQKRYKGYQWMLKKTKELVDADRP